MDKQLCKLYGESSRDFSRNIDPHAKQNIELLANLAVMELQFMHGCALDWRASSGGAAVSTCSRILNAGENGDDDFMYQINLLVRILHISHILIILHILYIVVQGLLPCKVDMRRRWR